MRGSSSIKPSLIDAGPATAAVRDIVTDFAAIDWFVPPNASQKLARELFLSHVNLTRQHLPKLYSEPVEVEFSTGGWEHFFALCNRVRGSGSFDWKYGVLKILSSEHAEACDWSLKNERSMMQKESDGSDTLLLRVGEHVFWCSLAPNLDLSELGKDHAECGHFYLSYVSYDATDAIQWQLAERSDSLAGNPFLPLLRCYAANFYPFVISESSVILFSFLGPR